MIDAVIPGMDLLQHRETQQLAYVRDLVVAHIYELQMVLDVVVLQEKDTPNVVVAQVQDAKLRTQQGQCYRKFIVVLTNFKSLQTLEIMCELTGIE